MRWNAFYARFAIWLLIKITFRINSNFYWSPSKFFSKRSPFIVFSHLFHWPMSRAIVRPIRTFWSNSRVNPNKKLHFDGSIKIAQTINFFFRVIQVSDGYVIGFQIKGIWKCPTQKLIELEAIVWVLEFDRLNAPGYSAQRRTIRSEIIIWHWTKLTHYSNVKYHKLSRLHKKLHVHTLMAASHAIQHIQFNSIGRYVWIFTRMTHNTCQMHFVAFVLAGIWQLLLYYI